ncbi:MAG: hypothetical protein KGO96_07760 [Elusimicrobia bacterium]|nr:hypothetical protein [Elusimicrobiota bacterium]
MANSVFPYGASGLTSGGLGKYTFTNNIPNIAPGSVNDTAKDILIKNFNPIFSGKNWTALLDGISQGDALNMTNAKSIFSQFFLSTASDDYLITRASDFGINYPTNVGMLDDTFRTLAIKTTAHKLTKESLSGILEIFYGDNTTRASLISGNAEPYAIYAGYQLNILVDNNTTLNVTFNASDFNSQGAALAIEVAMAITRCAIYNSINVIATAEFNPSTGLNYVRIYSPSLGLDGTVQILGGQAQDYLQFNTPLNITGDSTTVWSVAYSSTVSGNAKYSYVSGTQPAIWKSQVGDYVNIFPTHGNSSAFNSANQGSFSITKVGTTFFEIYNPNMVAQASVTTGTNIINTINFYRPTKGLLQTLSNYSAVSQNGTSNEIDIILPCTTTVVAREPPDAAYLQPPVTWNVSSVSRNNLGVVTVTTSTNHSLVAGNLFLIDGLIPDISTGASGKLNGQFTVLSSPAPTNTTFAYQTDGSKSAQISHASVSSNTVTVTTSGNNTLNTGQYVNITYRIWRRQWNIWTNNGHFC